VIVSLDTPVFSDLTCIVCGGLIPYMRAKLAAGKRNQTPKFCKTKCMHTQQMRAARSKEAAA
jgi:hypothetical protein